jgi:beta-galactosidase beta subunit
MTSRYLDLHLLLSASESLAAATADLALLADVAAD